ncbi:hypothetical protein pdam_00020913 [Pocillopora damicornis]|uniref:Uncharacterized protein n=1 Tax=Pocillopora damicornis TaxID=46731 RepID=A0A3M6UQ10_POCDA|nr:hypothetical protein pdam_00020913 [Pocillopora damicornis]
MSRILLIYHLLFLSSFLETKVVDVRGKPLSRGTVKGMAYAKFKVHKFSYLNITAIGSHYVGKGSECGFACVNIPSCFSFNLAEFQDINGKVLCELLPSDLYNNSDKLVPIQSHHHFSIASPCFKWPCQNNGKCAAQYEKNSYVCVCAKGYTGEHCETVYINKTASNLSDGVILFHYRRMTQSLAVYRSLVLVILTSAVLPSGPVTSMQTARTVMAPTHVHAKVNFMGMEKHIIVYPVSHEVFINETAIFFCWVQSQTSSKITWRKLGGTLSDATVENGALRINSVQRSHVGSYMCTAHTGLGIFRIVGRLLVKEVPQFTNKPPPKVVVEQGTTVTLCCVATGSPRPRVEWTRHQRSTLFSPFFQEDGCLAVNTAKAHGEEDYICKATNSFGLTETVTTVYCELTTDGRGWTLVARFSNNDVKNWMADTGHWWYDRQVATGKTESPFINTDMISPAFWLVRGSEFKITRSGDPSHTPLLQTTDI